VSPLVIGRDAWLGLSGSVKRQLGKGHRSPRKFSGRTGFVIAGLSLCSLALVPTATAFAAPPAECWVGWRPSEGSIAFANTGTHQTLMTVKLKWRSEDLTFVGCRERVAFELETNFGTSSNRHKLTHYTIIDSTFPAWYRDIAQEPQEATFGIGGAEKLVANKWYTIKFRFFGRLGPNEFISTTAARGYRYRSCVGAYAVCVNGWYQPEKFGPARLAILDRKPIAPGRTASWNYPARATLRNKILRNPNTRKAYTVDTSDVRHSIHDGGTYNCLTAKGWKVVNSFADIDQQWVIDSFKQGSDATCASVGSGDAGPGGGPGAAPPPAVGLAQGPAAPQGYRYAITLSGFAANTSVSVSCRDSVDPATPATALITGSSPAASSPTT
jgi:hypothetical protein